ncbi:hypothetical protein GCM10020331_076070 [Ectobacillus funiculus]
MPQEDIQAGYSNEDDYRMSTSDYYEHVVNMFMGWDKHEEVVNGHWPKKPLRNALESKKKYKYPLSRKRC